MHRAPVPLFVQTVWHTVGEVVLKVEERNQFAKFEKRSVRLLVGCFGRAKTVVVVEREGAEVDVEVCADGVERDDSLERGEWGRRTLTKIVDSSL
jgi:hypothetical protein